MATTSGLGARLTRLLKEAKILRAAREPDAAREKAARFLWERTNRLLAAARELMTDAERDRFDDALAEYVAEQQAEFFTDGAGGPLHDWLTSLRLGTSRLPELSAGAMLEVLRGHLAGVEDECSTGRVCDGCGLRRADSAALSPCPHCGGEAVTPDSRFRESDPAWRRMDGVMPRRV